MAASSLPDESSGEYKVLLDGKERSSSHCEVEADVEDPPSKAGDDLTQFMGGKTIGALGSFALAINNISGAGMLEIPRIYQEAGWVVPTFTFIFAGVFAGFAASSFCACIRGLPGNAGFSKRVEFSDPFERAFGRSMYYATHAGLYLTLVSQNIASIIATAQVMDALVAMVAGRTMALNLKSVWPTTFDVSFTSWDYTSCEGSGSCIAFEHEPAGDYSGMLLTAGYILTLMTLMPLSLLNLDDNASFQIFSFVSLLAITGEFLVYMAMNGLVWTRVPAFGDNYNNVIGTILFNYAFLVMLPSWLNEKRPEVSVPRTIWGSTAVATGGFIWLGIFGAACNAHVASNMLTTLSAPDVGLVTRLCAFFFGWVIIGLGIPVFCIVARYNLVNSRLVAPHNATLLGVVFPWATAWLLYKGKCSIELSTWAGLIVNGLTAFVAPLMLCLHAYGVAPNPCAVARALLAPPASMPPKTSEEEELADVVGLPRALIPFHRNLLAAALLMIVPLLILALGTMLWYGTGLHEIS